VLIICLVSAFLDLRDLLACVLQVVKVVLSYPELKTNKMDLKEIYFDPGHPGSFGGPQRLAKFCVSKQHALKFLQGFDTDTKHKRIVRNFPRRKIFSPAMNYLWQCDLIIMSKFGRVTKGFKYILACIDVLSRYGYAVPIRSKTGESIVEAFFKNILRSPNIFNVTRGQSFLIVNFRHF